MKNAGVDHQMDRLERVEAQLAAIGSHFTPPKAKDKKLDPTVTSINDLANEGIVREAKLEQEEPTIEEPTIEAKRTAAEWLKSTNEPTREQPRQHTAAEWPKTASDVAREKSTPAQPNEAGKRADATNPFTLPTNRMAELLSLLRCDQPLYRLGVNDSGEWQFRLKGGRKSVDGDRHFHQQAIVLTWSSRSLTPRENPVRFLSSTYSSGPFVTAVVYEADVDMVLLDEAWWRCSRENDVFTIRERVTTMKP
jgi:hypothetical protein